MEASWDFSYLRGLRWGCSWLPFMKIVLFGQPGTCRKMLRQLLVNSFGIAQRTFAPARKIRHSHVVFIIGSVDSPDIKCLWNRPKGCRKGWRPKLGAGKETSRCVFCTATTYAIFALSVSCNARKWLFLAMVSNTRIYWYLLVFNLSVQLLDMREFSGTWIERPVRSLGTA